MRTYGLYIDGQDRDADGWVYTVAASALIADPAEAFNVKKALEMGVMAPDDAPEFVVGRTAWGRDSITGEALEAAHRAKREWGASPARLRHELGHRLGEAIRMRREEFVDILIAEGHPRRLAEWEVGSLLGTTSAPMMDWNFAQLRQEYAVGTDRMLLLRKPDGVVCVSPPQNTAGATSALGLGALLAGNSVVVKAPKSCPLSVMWLYRDVVAPLLEEYGAPPGTLNLICGDSRRILRQWIDSPLVNDVMFVGGSLVGLRLGSDCVAANKKPILELAGNDCIVVWDDADLDAATTAMCESFYGSTQICMVPKQAIIHPAIADEAIAMVLEKVGELRPGYPEDPDVVLSPVLKKDRYYDYLAEARDAGAVILCGGEQLDVDGTPSATGLFVAPTVVRVDGLRDARHLTCVREETFFPLLPIIVPDTNGGGLADEVIDFLNANEYGLRNSLWTADGALVERFIDSVHNGGTLKVNRSHIGYVPVISSYGGTARTGGPIGELHYPILRTTHLQGVAVSPHGSYSSERLIRDVSIDGPQPDVVPRLLGGRRFTRSDERALEGWPPTDGAGRDEY